MGWAANLPAALFRRRGDGLDLLDDGRRGGHDRGHDPLQVLARQGAKVELELLAVGAERAVAGHRVEAGAQDPDDLGREAGWACERPIDRLRLADETEH